MIHLLDLLILVIEGLAGLGNGKLPVDFDLVGLPLAAPAVDLLSELGLGGNTPLQTLAGEGREIQLNLIKPGAALGGVVDLETLG